MSGDEPLSPDERKELLRLRRELAELRKDNEFLGIPAAYFAAKPPSKRDLR
jgi:transposase